MAFVIADRVRESSVSTGTGNFTLAGAVTGYQTFASVMATSDTTYYTIADQGGSNWEVGIGTFTSPSTLARTTILSSSNGGSVVTFGAGTKDVFISLPSSKTNVEDQPNLIEVNSSSAALRITQTGTGNALVVEDSANPDATPFVVNASGNVGIGTSSPGTTRLYISANRATDPVLQTWDTFNGATFENSALLSYDGTKTFFYNFQANPLAFGTNNAERMRIDSTGNVGIGTSSPASYAGYSTLTINNTTGAVIDLNVAGTRAGTFTMNASGAIFGTITNTPLGFWANSAERMRIDSSGNVGIGTSSPAGALSVYRATGTAQWAIQALNNVNTGGSGFWQRTNGQHEMVLRDTSNNANFITNSSNNLEFVVNGSERARIDASGNVGIGTSSPGSTLDVNGAITGRAVSGEGGELRLNNPTNASVGMYVDVSSADSGRVFSVSNNFTLSLGQLGGTGGNVLLYTAATERFRVGPSGQFGINGANYGTSGQVLTSNGAAAAPSWQAAAGFPSGTAMMFVQTAAPTGWTKSTTHDNKALRVVSGAASSGGSVAFTTAFASQTPAGTVGNTTLSTSQIPSHTHTYDGPVGGGCSYSGGGSSFVNRTSGATGGGGSHNHSFTGTAINLAVQYVDVIIATKD